MRILALLSSTFLCLSILSCSSDKNNSGPEIPDSRDVYYDRQVLQIVMDQDGNETKRTEYEYDSQSRLVSEKIYSADKLSDRREYNYGNGYSNCRHTYFDNEENVLGEYTELEIIYNTSQNTLPRVRTEYHTSAQEYKRTEYEYNDKDQVIGMLVYIDEDLLHDYKDFIYNGREVEYMISHYSDGDFLGDYYGYEKYADDEFRRPEVLKTIQDDLNEKVYRYQYDDAGREIKLGYYFETPAGHSIPYFEQFDYSYEGNELTYTRYDPYPSGKGGVLTYYRIEYMSGK